MILEQLTMPEYSFGYIDYTVPGNVKLDTDSDTIYHSGSSSLNDFCKKMIDMTMSEWPDYDCKMLSKHPLVGNLVHLNNDGRYKPIGTVVAVLVLFDPETNRSRNNGVIFDHGVEYA